MRKLLMTVRGSGARGGSSPCVLKLGYDLLQGRAAAVQEQVGDVLQQEGGRAAVPQDPGDLVEELPPGVLESLLLSGLGERLAAEAGGEHVVRRDVVKVNVRDVAREKPWPLPNGRRERCVCWGGGGGGGGGQSPEGAER